MNKILTGNIKLIGAPILMLIGLIALFVLASTFIVSRINALFGEYDTQKQEMVTLNEKLSSLQASSATISGFAQSLAFALPDKNTSLMIVSQLKTLASENTLTMQNIKVGSELKDGQISHVDVSFDIEGQSSTIFSFLNQTKTIAPINKLTRFRLSTTESGSRANITLSSYWAAFPTKIPAVSDPLVKITAEEERTLQVLGALRKPAFGELTPNVGESEVSNPFGI